MPRAVGEQLLHRQSTGYQQCPIIPEQQQSHPENQGSYSSTSPMPWSKGDLPGFRALLGRVWGQ